MATDPAEGISGWLPGCNPLLASGFLVLLFYLFMVCLYMRHWH